jgi:hypothetical protein
MKFSNTTARAACSLFFIAVFFIIFPESRFLFTKVYLVGDSLTYYYPLAVWAKSQMAEGHLPLLSDLAYHGAPLAAQSSIGLLSPVLLVLLCLPLTFGYNLILFLPLAISLVGFYRLGRHYGFARSSAIFLSLLGSLNGAADVHLSLFIVTWANAFFPWTWRFLSRFARNKHWKDAWWAAFFFGLTVAVGHPQMVLMQGMVIAFWVLAAPEMTFSQRLKASTWIIGGGLLFSSPRWLHTLECVFHGTGATFRWNDLDAFFHSWTPFNFITLLFPDFFGHTLLTGETTYWWLYHYNEMHFTLGVIGLCFLILYFLRPDPHRRWILCATTCFVLMSLGRYGPLYPLLRPIPPFEWFRDPSRWLLPTGWLLAFASARAWQGWIQESHPRSILPKIAGVLLLVSGSILLTGHWLITFAQPLLRRFAGFFIAHFVKGDTLHPGDIDSYLNRLPEKLAPLAKSLDIHRAEVILPIVLLTVVWFLANTPSKNPKTVLIPSLLFLCLFELSFFNLRLGTDGFIDPRLLPPPSVPAPQNRLLTLTPHTPLPHAAEVAKLAFPNANFLTGRPSLPLFLYPSLPRYEEICSRVGWMSWVYHDRDSEGWRKHPHLLQALGVDLIVSNEPLTLSAPFRPVSTDSFAALSLTPVANRVMLYDRFELCPWSSFIDKIELLKSDPLHVAFLETTPNPSPVPGATSAVVLQQWSDTHVHLTLHPTQSLLLVLQKTYLPSWIATLNGQPATLLRAQGVLCGLALPAGMCDVDLQFKPSGLRLALFLSMVFLALGTGFRRND